MSAQPTAVAAGTIEIGGDLTVNRMGFGAMRITGRGIWGEPPSRDQAIATLRRVVELGVNFIDTADSYGPSVSEELIAEALYPYPDELVIATKGGLVRPGPNRWDPDGRPKHLREACEGSLRRLRLEQIPLWQFHRPDPKVPLAESIGAIAELKDEGKIRHVGISNVSEAQFREAERILPIVSIQNRFNVTDRDSESLIDLCEQEDMVFLPWAPIQQADRKVAVAVAAERRGVTERQIVLAWLLAISPAILPIPGTGSPEHAEENVAATAIELSRDEIEAISKGGLSRVRLFRPFRLVGVLAWPDTGELVRALNGGAVDHRLGHRDEHALQSDGEQHLSPPPPCVGWVRHVVLMGGGLPDLPEQRRGQLPYEHAGRKCTALCKILIIAASAA